MTQPRKTRSLTARSVIASTLLGTEPPRLPGRVLVRVGDLFGITEGTARTALSRMVAAGELVADDGSYQLSEPKLLERQARQSASRRATRHRWHGAWVMAIVVSERRDAAARADLRTALESVRLAELREGVWLRPDNIDVTWPPVVGEQCTIVHARDVDPSLVDRLWPLRDWADRADELRGQMQPLVARLERGATTALADGFVVSAAVLRHFQADPLLPEELLPKGWPGAALREEYDRFDVAYRDAAARLLPYPSVMDDRVYFRQLLSGRDFAQHDNIARQMVNFVYLIGDRETGEAVAVDPAYDIRGLLDILAADDMKLVGALATHYHPDHVGGSMGGFTISGVRELLTLHPVPIHVQADEAPWVKRVTDASDSDLVEHQSGDQVMVGDIPIELIHTPGHTPGSQCFFVDGKLVAGDTLFLEGCGRLDLPGRRSGRDVRKPHAEAGEGAGRRDPLPRASVFDGAVRVDGRDPPDELRVPPEDRRAMAHDVRQLTDPRHSPGRVRRHDQGRCPALVPAGSRAPARDRPPDRAIGPGIVRRRRSSSAER